MLIMQRFGKFSFEFFVFIAIGQNFKMIYVHIFMASLSACAYKCNLSSRPEWSIICSENLLPIFPICFITVKIGTLGFVKLYMSPFFSPTRSFPSDAVVPIMIPIGVLFLVSLELTLSDISQNGLKHQTYTNFKGSPGT